MAVDPTLDDLERLGAAARRAGFEIFERDRLADAEAWAEETRFALRVIAHFAEDAWRYQSVGLWRGLDSAVSSWCAHFLKQETPQFPLRLVAAWRLAETPFSERVATEEAVLANDRLNELVFDYARVALHWLVREWYRPTTTEGNDGDR